MRVESSSKTPYEEKTTQVDIVLSFVVLMVSFLLVYAFSRYYGDVQAYSYLFNIAYVWVFCIWFYWRRIVVTPDSFMVKGIFGFSHLKIKLSDISQIELVQRRKLINILDDYRGVVEIAYTSRGQNRVESLLCVEPTLLGIGLLSAAPHIAIGPLKKWVSTRISDKVPLDPSVMPMKASVLEHYRLKYPHNPEGVLAFHIDRLKKEGRTTEEALLELKRQLAVDQ